MGHAARWERAARNLAALAQGAGPIVRAPGGAWEQGSVPQTVRWTHYTQELDARVRGLELQVSTKNECKPAAWKQHVPGG